MTQGSVSIIVRIPENPARNAPFTEAQHLFALFHIACAESQGKPVRAIVDEPVIPGIHVAEVIGQMGDGTLIVQVRN